MGALNNYAIEKPCGGIEIGAATAQKPRPERMNHPNMNSSVLLMRA
jgi:hypothetical protein